MTCIPSVVPKHGDGFLAFLLGFLGFRIFGYNLKKLPNLLRSESQASSSDDPTNRGTVVPLRQVASPQARIYQVSN